MSTLTEISLASTKDAFLAAPEPIKRIPTLASLINLMHHTYQCSQTQKTPASATMTILFVQHPLVSIPSSQTKCTLQVTFCS